MGRYIHEQAKWPAFSWDNDRIIGPLADVRYTQGRLLGKWGRPGSPRLKDGLFEVLTLEATRDYDQPLTQEHLLVWHTALFPAGINGEYQIRAGVWRDDASGPMQLVSTTPAGAEHIHYEAPAAARIDKELSTFLAWFNGDTAIDPVIKAAIAHLRFATIYPFDEGTGRLARAITDRQLARAEANPHRLYSIAPAITADQHAYYNILEQTQKGDLDITDWLLWFLERFDQTITKTEEHLSAIVPQGNHPEAHHTIPLNERQRTMLSKLDEGFEGNLTSTKWAELVQCSPDTALRDIHDLMDKGVLEKEEGGGRSTRYRMKGG